MKRTFLIPVLSVLLLFAANALQAAAIHKAVRNNDIVGVEKALSESDGTAVEAVLGGGITPLHVAAALDYRAIAGLLLCQGAKVNQPNLTGFTPLHWAAGKDAVKTLDLLITFGADINIKAKNGITPLHYAASKNATNAVSKLLAAGADVNLQTESGLAPLHWALMNDASDASVLIAYHATTQEMERRWAAAPEPEPEPLDLPPPPEPVVEEPVVLPPAVAGDDTDPEVTEMIAIEDGMLEPKTPARPSGFARPEFGKALTVAIGFNERLDFVWVEALQAWFGKYEVTNGQYKRFKPRHKSLFREAFNLDGKAQPAVYVSWNDTKAFCRWLNREYGDRLPLNCEFRLPASREWMVVARAGKAPTYVWGEKWPPRFGNVCDLTARRELTKRREGVRYYDDGFAVSCPVTESGANDWDIHGLAGNVWEWCEDWYNQSSEHKIRHGGSWDTDSRDALRIDYRGFDRPDTKDDTIGFRLVVSRTQ